LFFTLGVAAAKLFEFKKAEYAAAVLLIVFAILSINGGIALTGSVYTLQNFYKAATSKGSVLAQSKSVAPVIDGKQQATIYIKTGGYSSDVTTLQSGVPVRIALTSNNAQGCARAFTIPSLNISKILPENGTEIIEFTPREKGSLAFSCSMGMYTGSFKII
jgi:plastocyanin domain-containing protein